jgi:UDP-glucose 4-epimerase
LLETVRALVPDSPTEPPQHEDARAGEVVRSCLDVSRAESELGWRATTPLAEGLRITLEAV